MDTIWKVLTRRKVLEIGSEQETPLARVLNTFDLTALGVGSTLGVGVYVLAGEVAKETAGPAVVLSFLIAAVASVFAGLCYAEFGARTPRAGSAYIYSYLCVGEFIAFVIGWNLILEYIIGSASVAKGLSSYLDNLTNGTLNKTFVQIAPIDFPYLSDYFDFLAFTVPIILAIALAFGMKESSLVNNIFTTINIGVVLFVVIVGSLNANWDNWFIDVNDVKNVTNGTNLGKGGFFPFGIEGVIKGAATCFYGFVGFDCIATTGEEVRNPKRAIPVSIILSLLIIFLSYFGTSSVLTLMLPYYEQDKNAPIPFAFQYLHLDTAAIVVSIGAIFGLYASLFGAMFPLPRILYAMATDGLIFKCMGEVNERFRTPIVGTLLAGLFTGLMAAVLTLDSLVNMMSIGTLLAYSIVAACVLLLRYSRQTEPELTLDEVNLSVSSQIFNFGKTTTPTRKTEIIVAVAVCFYCVLCFLLALCGLHLRHQVMEGDLVPVIVVSTILLLIALTLISITSQPISRQVLSFQVPWVPLIPALSILFNIYLMVMLDIITWIRFVVWMVVGFPIFYLSWTRKPPPPPLKGRLNAGFYGDNLSYTNNHNGTVSSQETAVLVEETKPSSLRLSDCDSNISKLSVPSPSKVLETLDLVIDSYIDSLPVSPVSVESISVSSESESSYVSATSLVVPPPPPPPCMSEFEKFAEATISPPVSITASTLSSVLLKPVHRPSLVRRSVSVDDNLETANKRNHFKRSESVHNTSENKYNSPSISKEAISSVKLRHVQRPSLRDAATTVEDRPDSVKFGTEDFEKFKTLLNEKLRNPTRRVPSLYERKSRNEAVGVVRENVIEDKIDMKKAMATMQAEIESKLKIIKGARENDQVL